MTDSPPELPIVELTLVRFHPLAGWSDRDYRLRSRAQVVADLAFAAAIRGKRFDHAWPLVSESRVHPMHIDNPAIEPTHVMLYGRVWAVPIDQ